MVETGRRSYSKATALDNIADVSGYIALCWREAARRLTGGSCEQAAVQNEKSKRPWFAAMGSTHCFLW